MIDLKLNWNWHTTVKLQMEISVACSQVHTYLPSYVKSSSLSSEKVIKTWNKNIEIQANHSQAMKRY